MNTPVEGGDLAADKHYDYTSNPLTCSLGNDNESLVSELYQVIHGQQVTKFIIAEPSRMLRLPCPAPPPKLHYSTWWRSVTRRMYRENASLVLKKLQADIKECKSQT
jgi:hypothetical protein